jgi:hypothetical protein
MNRVTIIDPLKDSQWDEFVENHPFGWICHLSGWKRVLEKSFKHIKGNYLVLRNDNRDITAALPIFEVRSWLTGNRLVSIPFATLCDPLISTGQEMEDLLEGALRLLKEFRASYIEIRSFRASSFVQTEKLAVRHFYKHHSLELKADPEELKKSFHRSCVRQRIARSLRSDLELRMGVGESDLQRFYRLYILTRKRLGLPPQPYVFLKSIWEIFSSSKRVTLLLAEQRGQPIAGLMLLKFKDRVSAEFSASDEAFYDMSPNHFLFWEAIKFAYDEGYKIFDFGRTAPSNETLMDFKARWGTEVTELPQYYYPKQVCQEFDRKGESISYRFLKEICENAPASALQYFGHFCYRHLG